METKKTEQKWFIWNSKFGKRFYALVIWLAIILSGWFYFFVSAQSLEVATDLNNSYQTIKRVRITSDGTPAWTTYFDFNNDLNWGAFVWNWILNWTIVKVLWLDGSNQLVYSVAEAKAEEPWTVDGNDIYRLTWNVSIWINNYPGKLNVVSSDLAKPELYLEQTSDSASNIHFKVAPRTRTVWAYSTTNDYFYIWADSNAYFTIYPSWASMFWWDVDMWTNNIDNADIITAVAFVMSSDKTLKENIQKIENPLGKIYQLNGYTFDWKKDWRKDLWLIAQEVEKVLPELVHVDMSGHKWVEYGNMVWLLVEGIKELWDRVEWLYNKYLDQQKKLDDLESRIILLEGRDN